MRRMVIVILPWSGGAQLRVMHSRDGNKPVLTNSAEQADTRAPPPRAAVTRSNPADSDWATRHSYHWADQLAVVRVITDRYHGPYEWRAAVQPTMNQRVGAGKRA